MRALCVVVALLAAPACIDLSEEGKVFACPACAGGTGSFAGATGGTAGGGSGATAGGGDTA
ncbi:MAG: hypothetical protein JNK82_35450, partial [Myxococcaceae bacterium]|nr:hypothetical protein [Myxococcaceae bacterium]